MRLLVTPLAILLLSIFAENVHSAAALNVSIAVFDPGVPADQSLHRAQLGVPIVR